MLTAHHPLVIFVPPCCCFSFCISEHIVSLDSVLVVAVVCLFAKLTLYLGVKEGVALLKSC